MKSKQNTIKNQEFEQTNEHDCSNQNPKPTIKGTKPNAETLPSSYDD